MKNVEAPAPTKSSAPTPDAVRAARLAAGHTLQQAAETIELAHFARWSEYERGLRPIDPARWALYLLRTDQHPEYRIVRRRGKR